MAEEYDEEEQKMLEQAAAAEEEEDDMDVDVANDEDEDEDEDEGAGAGPQAPMSPNAKEVAKKEKARLRDLAKARKEQMDHLLEEQNKAVATEGTGKNKLRFLLKQTDMFSHFMNSSRGEKKGGKKKASGAARGKLTEEEEDADFMEGDEGPVVETRLTVQPKCITGKMREYQLQGLNWLIRCYDHGINGILADEMGLGKTLQSISLLGYLHEHRGIKGPHLVIAPKSTVGNWLREFKRWCPAIRSFKFLGNQEERQKLKDSDLQPGKFDAVITSYEMVIKEKSAFRKFAWRYIVIDEAHRIKNENSVLSRTVRMFHSNYRLLITGTPLQNNLHELWALLNFLLPEVFKHAEDFDEWFQITGENDEAEVVKQLHKVLRPFLLRRLKSEVEAGMPPKKETILKIGMSAMQKQYYRSLLQKDVEVIKNGGERSRLLNIVMQLRKCCNHPYLFQGAEPGPPYITGEHLIENAGKMVLLDKLLRRLKERDSRVLIFSQMTRQLDILEDYCIYRGFQYCRIDGNTSGDDRDEQIDQYNREGSEKFIFLLSTRAGGLGINLATADIVVLYDSDWNPQMDLQAMDRAHRIGQKKEVHVYRFTTEGAIEEKIVEKAYKKLALDALVIQQGRLAEAKTTVSKDEMLAMVRYGADKVFDNTDGTIADEDIDAIIAKGEEAQAQLNDKMKDYTENAIKFSMDGQDDLYAYAAEDNAANVDEIDGEVIKTMIAANWVDPPKRERKKNYNESDIFRAQQKGGQSGPKSLKLPRPPQTHDFQFYDDARLRELYDKEAARVIWEHNKEQERAALQAQRDAEAVPTTTAANMEVDESGAPPKLSEDEVAEREALLEAGFGTWNRREFQCFVRCCEKYGRANIEAIHHELGMIETQNPKSVAEVGEYSKAFWENYTRLNDWERLIRNIEKGEQRIQRKDEITNAIGCKLQRYKNPWRDLKVVYGQNKGKSYTEEEDRFILCMTHQLGYGSWEELKLEIRKSWMFRFDWFFKSRTPQELARRCETLVRMVEKENAELEEAENAKKKGGGKRKDAAPGGGGNAGAGAKKAKAAR